MRVDADHSGRFQHGAGIGLASNSVPMLPDPIERLSSIRASPLIVSAQ
jgi:hypothetical protein